MLRVERWTMWLKRRHYYGYDFKKIQKPFVEGTLVLEGPVVGSNCK